MTAIANATRFVLTLFGLVCASIVAIFIVLAYSGNATQIAKVGCALQTNGVVEYTACMTDVVD